MSHVALQRVLVRMLYDPAFVRAIYAEPAKALAGEDLSPVEQGWLVQPDPRAYATDPHRRARTLAALLEEYPVSSALVVRARGDAAVLDAFFTGPLFHRCIAERGSLADAFGRHIIGVAAVGRLADARAVPIARLEQAVARVRRAPAPPAVAQAEERPLVASQHAAGLRLPLGTLALRQQILRALESHPRGVVAALLDPIGRVTPQRLDARAMEDLLVERQGDEVGVAEAPPELVALIIALAEPRPYTEALALVRELGGAEPGEDAEILSSLVEDGLLHPTLDS